MLGFTAIHEEQRIADPTTAVVEVTLLLLAQDWDLSHCDLSSCFRIHADLEQPLSAPPETFSAFVSLFIKQKM